ncbi:MAG: citrate (Si)-synthase [Methanomassiliicoccales archaeon]|nr:citrate (Si)-synthase [Methanomassiliicoccales archaeon]
MLDELIEGIMTEKTEKVVVRGLRDVAAADTSICYVDPMGVLYYVGYNIDDLVGRVIYAEVAFLLVHKRLPNQKELDEFNAQLVSEMRLPEAVVECIRNAPKDCHPMEILRTEVSRLGQYSPGCMDLSDEANLKRATQLIAQVPTIVATIHRCRTNQPVLAPREDLSFAENFLYLFNGTFPDKDETDVLHRLMILHADHGFNASTFAARVTASTNSDMYSAVTSAIGTLRGPLHGGAGERVMDMLEDIGLEEHVEEYIQGLLDEQKKVMGFGHRIYRAEDPRTKHLREIVENFCHRERTMELCNKCIKIEAIVHDRKKIYPNLDFYAAVAMDALGVPKEYFTPFFTSSRIAGWVAHVIEQYDDAILLRPASNYVGEFGRKFVPIEER